MSEYIEVIGKVIAVLPGTMFRVELQNKHVVLLNKYCVKLIILLTGFCRMNCLR